MKATIDKAGRIVIPASIRERAGLKPGTEVDIELEDGSVKLVRSVTGPELVKVDGLWLIRPTVPDSQLPDIDIGALIDEERNRWPGS